VNKLRTIGTAILKRHGFFSIDQVIGATKYSRRYCRDVLTLFCQEGIIKQIKKGRKEHIPGRPPIFAMIYRVIDRKKFAARIVPRRLKNTIQDRMWFIIWNKFRNNGSFNLHDLTVLAGAKKGMARWYLKALRRAGYIIPSRSGGAPGVEWRLTGKLGPERPYLDHSRGIKRDSKRRPNSSQI
jgi:hypothetical protein